ncbi:sigma-B regulation protein RsbU (phosphoserine phosphatase) [Lachnospiraceae bacterium RM5]|nr:sigma-B regulation protein RsbU (phosphoserine phosphatase) [Lachnospiraceae bacterium RM5]
MNKKKHKISIVFKSVIGIICIMILFSVAIGIMGFRSYTNALLEQYSEGAFNTAKIAKKEFDVDKIEEYAKSGGKTEEYLEEWQKMSDLCNASGSTFVYVIRPDLKDYKHITFLFSTINKNSDYSCYDFGYVRETTNEEYMEKYRNLYENKTNKELLVRDKGYIETDPHITAMIPLKDNDGNTVAILCVQRQMDKLVKVRNNYIAKIFYIFLVLIIFVIVVQAAYLNHVFLRPFTSITEETIRFSDENTLPEKKLSEKIKSNDEIGILADSIDNMEESIIKYIDEVTKATIEKERIAVEFDLAGKIQVSMLPTTFPAFPDRKEFDIYASMNPAKEVGGDFYDFFLIDDDHLCLVIADVSGKGVPAALFMMASKILFANYAKMGKSPSEILEAANNAICNNNPENMFVTVWLGILEISTGKLRASNAGHEYPALMEPDGKFEIYKDKHGFVIGGMKGINYKEYEVGLKKGSKLFVYTDGVVEATNVGKELFGNERMLDALNEKSVESPESILENIKKSVDIFVEDEEQFDDLTMLCLEYKGK